MATVQIDYLSFTLDLVNRIDDLHLGLEVVGSALHEKLGSSLYRNLFLQGENWSGGGGAKPYKYRIVNNDIGIFIFYGGHSHAKVQFSGQGCKWLMKHDAMSDVVRATVDRILRLDIAIDIETDTKPSDFVAQGYNGRIRSDGRKRSPDGETEYVGARTSAKFCRVYRYNEPHPRSHLLRVEYETHKEQAQILANLYLERGLTYAADSMTAYYKWGSKEMPMHNEMVEAIASHVTTRSDGKTMHWLLKQCAPAIRRLIENGTIENPQEFFNEHFLPERLKEHEN